MGLQGNMSSRLLNGLGMRPVHRMFSGSRICEILGDSLTTLDFAQTCNFLHGSLIYWSYSKARETIEIAQCIVNT